MKARFQKWLPVICRYLREVRRWCYCDLEKGNPAHFLPFDKKSLVVVLCMFGLGLCGEGADEFLFIGLQEERNYTCEAVLKEIQSRNFIHTWIWLIWNSNSYCNRIRFWSALGGGKCIFNVYSQSTKWPWGPHIMIFIVLQILLLLL